MTQTQALLALFKLHGDELTLGQILAEKGKGFGSNQTGRISDARKKLKLEGKTIVCHKGDIPTENIYRIEAIPILENGQYLFL